ncbi:D-2-hydroxyacid dehydrogenase family protein [Pseudoneobacillus rhizosphaerae]|uniref:Hydroxypyruvate reductase n=1 Tax=Pseudoneobacillus rhizosphaerae TaxID=2880968 RepID=A0A9C7LBV7_9BACI|nr:D-2-hydroxyacid dehydrogenase family protein [Pseudoneobacillus rhizosphaerae]CAG9609842.1 Hydroxypyruvate reductase [Pseudoneobacillus rhizosphaerae]
MKLKCAILDDYQNAALTMADWSVINSKVDVEVFQEHFKSEDKLINVLDNYEIIVIMRERTAFSASVISRLPKLKLLITSGMRNASIDLAAATAHGVTVCGTGSRSEPPLELTWALILGLSRHIVKENQSIRENGPWQSTIGVDLFGKRLGIIGLGKIGSKTAQVGKAFGMDVVAWSQNLTEERTAEVGVTLASSLEELLTQSDFVSIHLVLSERTKHLIGERELQHMKSQAYLINTSRAAIIDQSALITALENNWIAGAGLDVYEQEPLSDNHVFRKLDNVLALPHLGYVSENNYRIYFKEAVENIQAYLDGQPIRKIN